MLRFLFLFLLVILNFSVLQSQNSCTDNRYTQERFSTHYIEDLKYCSDAPQLIFPWEVESFTIDIDLYMDVRIPDTHLQTAQPDTATKRPLMIWAHAGGFISGNKGVDDMQALIDTFARRGFVTASMQYRLGLDATDAAGGGSTSPERAVWRATQDASSAIRFFKENADVFGIDTNFVFVGGSSAGAFAALHVSYAENNERPPSTYSGFLRPNLGDKDIFPIEKYSAILPAPVSSGQNAGAHSSYPTGLYNCWGAIGDTTWMGPPSKVPLISFHGDSDIIVPIEDGNPFQFPWFPTTYGTIPIHQRANNIGVYNEMNVYPGYGHETWGALNGNFGLDNQPDDQANWEEVILKITNFTYQLMQPLPHNISGDNNVTNGSTHTYSVTSPVASSKYCWDVSGGMIVGASTDSSTIDIEWYLAGTHTIKSREITCNVVEGDWATYSVDVCGDGDLDGVCDGVDNCVLTFNPSQTDTNNDGVGDACEPIYIGCDPFYSLSLPFVSGDFYKYEASDYILANDVIQNGAEVTFDAGGYVLMLNGFEAKAGSVFHAYIDGCGNAKTNNLIASTPPHKIEVYPNPNNGSFLIKSDTEIIRTELYNVKGQLIQSLDINGTFTQINNVPQGNFWLKVLDKNGKSEVVKVVVFSKK